MVGRSFEETKVTISYSVGAAATGFSVVPSQITYAGYKVNLGYLPGSGTAISGFGTGTATLGTLWNYLGSVSIYDGTTPIRAYNLVRTSSALTSTKLLQKVETYGSDFVLTSGAVTAGSKLPDVTYEYSADTYTLASIMDISVRKRNEILLRASETAERNTSSSPCPRRSPRAATTMTMPTQR